MRIALAGDHAGFSLKQTLGTWLRSRGETVLDLGAKDPDPSDDYPDYAEAVGVAVAEGRADRGLLVCGSGVGVAAAANKIPGVRAGMCHDHYSAHQGVEHDDMNVLALGARVVGEALALELVDAFLSAHFTGEERHVRRLAKLRLIEVRYARVRGEEGPAVAAADGPEGMG
ncbi:MAG TPA: ribose 5-phosphate isomerase B [Anaeromyxobacteraceae bacterium]|nr:ribose 5-phosphate isomerase B [Anaeromyxobacteraceae bacterium]